MGHLIEKFKSWCDRNISIITFFALVATILGLGYNILNGTKINFGIASNLFSNIGTILNYKIQLPVYLYLLVIIVIYGLFRYLINSDKHAKDEFSFLVGTWLNEWDLNGSNSGSEKVVIDATSAYCRNGEHIFNVENFSINYKKSEISFDKISVRPGDNRRAHNKLNIVNKDLLTGNEEGYAIRYTRIN